MVLKDKVVLVTGASKGIGRALAVGLAADGASVAISFKTDESGAEKTRRTIEQQGRTVFAIQADLGERDQAVEMIEQVVRHFGRIDALSIMPLEPALGLSKKSGKTIGSMW